jgi:hypothetical protein
MYHGFLLALFRSWSKKYIQRFELLTTITFSRDILGSGATDVKTLTYLYLTLYVFCVRSLLEIEVM